MLTQTINCPRCGERTLAVADDGESVQAVCTDAGCGYSDNAYWNGGAA